jgi:two-component system, LytTR family, sensor kinase
MNVSTSSDTTESSTSLATLHAWRTRLRRLPLFWRFQLAGWLAFVIGFSLFKLLLVNDAWLAFGSSLFLEPVGFLITLAMYRYYRQLSARLSATQIVWRVLITCVIVMAIDVTWFSLVRHYFFDDQELALPGVRGIMAVAIFRFMIYACWSFLYFWIKAALASAAAVAAANAAQLQALRAQLNPHFLFNALNSISAETEDNPRAVKALSHELASYLRYSLAHRHQENVLLAAEIDAMAHYLNVEKTRFEERLHFTIEATDEARATLVPGFFLQPLVENAVKHGLRTSPAAIKILIRAACANDTLRLEVSNTGEWRESNSQAVGPHQGFGLESIQSRLVLLYPNAHRLDIEHDTGWVNVAIEIPRA